MNASFFPKAGALLSLLAGALGALGAGCGVNSGYDAQRDNPLGPSFWIIPVPSDDDALLGRTFARPPDASLTLEEQSAPNPCADKLAERRDSQMTNHYENAINTNTSAKAGGILALYGFSAEVGKATHLLYKVNTSTKITRLDTAEYQACCKEKGCGWGYIASLVKGDGEYAAGSEATAQVSGNYSVVTGGVSRSYAVSNKKNIKGYIAAILVAHNRAEAAQACPPGQQWAKIECVDKALFAKEEELCKKGNPQASDAMWKGNEQMQSLFKQQQENACRWIAAHGGPSTALPPPPASAAPAPTPTAATPAPAAEAPFEPGDFVAINSFWSGKMTFRPDGTFERDSGQKGVWIAEGKKLTLKWSDGSTDELARTAPGAYQNFTGFFQIKRTGASPAASSPAPTTSAPAPATSAPTPATSAPAPAASAPAPATSAPTDRKRRR
jgi:hypothetical protein